MLIYNHLKEFVGISQSDLNHFGYSDLAELRSESADFADMFVKTPGFVHNFKHIHWIDFILSSDSIDGTNVIIHAKSKNYQCSLDIEIVYLSSDPSSHAYLIHINNIRQTTDEKIQLASQNIVTKPLQTPSTPIQKPVEAPVAPKQKPVEEVIAAPQQIPEPIRDTKPISIDFDDEVEIPVQAPVQPKTEQKPIAIDLDEPAKPQPVAQQATKQISIEEEFDNGYVYNPQIASDELGLPLDLIEEFIGDFIAQAQEFKDGMYKAHNERDNDKLKILSHKLKGVAANLRIEDAFEALTTINTSDDPSEIEKQLDLLYKIVAKLSKNDFMPTEIQSSGDKSQADDIDLDIFAPVANEPEIHPVNTQQTVQSTPVSDVIDIDFDEPTPEPSLTIEEPKIEQNNAPIQINLEDDPILTPQVQVQIHYDKQRVANEIGMSMEDFSLIFNDFVEESLEVVQSLHDAVENGDLQRINKKATQLKGMNENMRINDCKEELEQLQTIQNVDTAKALCLKIEAVMHEISNLKG